jgi:glutathione S-transferase
MRQEIPMKLYEFAPTRSIRARWILQELGVATGRRYIAGDRVSAADFVIAYTLDWADEARLPGECPALRNYLELMYDRDRAPRRIGDLLRELRRAPAETANA